MGRNPRGCGIFPGRSGGFGEIPPENVIGTRHRWCSGSTTNPRFLIGRAELHVRSHHPGRERRCGGNRTRVGGLLGLNRDQIRYRIEKFGLTAVP